VSIDTTISSYHTAHGACDESIKTRSVEVTLDGPPDKISEVERIINSEMLKLDRP